MADKLRLKKIALLSNLDKTTCTTFCPATMMQDFIIKPTQSDELPVGLQGSIFTPRGLFVADLNNETANLIFHFWTS